MKLATSLRAALAATLLLGSAWSLHAESVLRMVPQANLVALDPVWTTAYVSRNHGYMVYDTLFGTNEKGEIKPQMVDHWTASPDKKVWTFTLREGLAFSDGNPVTSDDVIASLNRWAARDTMGIVMRQFLERMDAVDAKTFRMTFHTPFGLTLEAIGQEGRPPFIMPKRVADTSPSDQIKDFTGSGPYVLKLNEYKPGEKIVYVKNDKYVPRKEAASGSAGGKQVFVDRVEWIVIRDPQTQLNALRAGEVDMIEQPAGGQYSGLRAMPGVALVETNPSGAFYALRFNFLNPPFDNVLVRRAAMLALGQEQVLRTQVATPGLFRYCRSIYPCGSVYASDDTGLFTGVANPAASRKLLQEAGYKGMPVVLMRPSDLATLSKAPLVVKQQLEQGGFTVDLQTMDWQTLLSRRAKKEPGAAGGWDAFITSINSSDSLSPLTMLPMNASGDRGWFGWQNDPVLEDIKKKFAAATTDADKKKFAAAAALQSVESVTHVNLGQFSQPAAVRDNVEGLLPTGALVLWNVKKKP